MKIIQRILVGASIFATLGFSGIITGVSVIINDEPITLYEVYKYSQKYKVSKKESLEILVRQKLEQSQIKKLGITADIFEVDNYIDNLASKNNMSQYEFLNMLKSKDIKITDYKKELKNKIKTDKLYQTIYRDKIKGIEESELKKFYDDNQEEFKLAGSFDVNIYTAQNPNDLVAIQKNPMLQPKRVKIQSKTLYAKELDRNLNALLNRTKDGTFTQIINNKEGSTMLFVKSKGDFQTIPFEKAKPNIYRVLSQQKEQKAIKDYFEKLKSSASIVVVRPPS